MPAPCQALAKGNGDYDMQERIVLARVTLVSTADQAQCHRLPGISW
jgi:hypothetical protein